MRTEPSAETAVINLVVQALHAVMGRKNRAYIFARRIITVLAHHNQPSRHLRVVVKVSLNADPGHFAALDYLLSSHHGDIVFRVASQHTGTTADTPIQVDDHAPAVIFVLARRVKIFLFLVSVRQRIIDMGLSAGCGRTVSLSQAHGNSDFTAMLEKAPVGICYGEGSAGFLNTDMELRPMEPSGYRIDFRREQFYGIGRKSIGKSSEIGMPLADGYGKQLPREPCKRAAPGSPGYRIAY